MTIKDEKLLSKGYEFAAVEEKWLDQWQQNAHGTPGTRIPGQSLVLEAELLLSSPGQSCPPFEVDGESHSLVLLCVPPPQLTEQEPHEPQSAQEPSTG